MPTPKKPTVVQIREGETHKDRINQNEPKPKQTLPKCPTYLSKESKKIWRKLAKELNNIGLLTSIDGSCFEAYCIVYGTAVEAEKRVQKEGQEITTTNGNRIQNPALGIRNKALDMMFKYGKEFGLMPAPRSSISIEGLTGESDPMEEHLKSRWG